MLLSVHISQTNHFTISSDFVKIFIAIVAFVVIYFLSSQILRNLAKITKVIGLKLGTYSTNMSYSVMYISIQILY